MARSIQAGLQEAGFSSDICATGFEGEEMASGQQYDIIVLDLMLPDRDGLEICRNLRRRKVATPLIMLTALGSTEDKVAGLDAGADDFLPKPFKFEELLARIRAVLRRGQATEGKTLRCDD
ncbi:MAG TPA: response regulator, partial [Phycisphaerales bacterium]|nr:response regulator [Phycisphaerales bacterium]